MYSPPPQKKKKRHVGLIKIHNEFSKSTEIIWGEERTLLPHLLFFSVMYFYIIEKMYFSMLLRNCIFLNNVFLFTEDWRSGQTQPSNF